MAICKPEKESSPGPDPVRTLVLDLQCLELGESKFLCLSNNIVKWQPKIQYTLYLRGDDYMNTEKRVIATEARTYLPRYHVPRYCEYTYQSLFLKFFLLRLVMSIFFLVKF